MKSITKVILGIVSIIVVITFIVGLFVAPIVIQYNHKQEFEGTITDKYNKRDGDKDKFYIVLDNKTVLKNQDLLFKGRFNSSDVQATLKNGDKVKVKTIGYRVHFLSMYPNIYEINKQ